MFQEFVRRYTTIPIVGVDLGSTVLKVVEASPANGRVMLKHSIVAEIKGKEPALLLKQVLHEAHITTTDAALALASPEVIARSFQFPRMPKKELDSAIQLEAEQAVLNGHSPNEVAVDWHTLSTNSKDLIRGILAVVPKSVIAHRRRVIEAAGLHPRIVDVEGLALWNAYWVLLGRHETISKTILLINIGVRTTNIVIAKSPDELILIRDLQLGAGALEQGQDKEWISELRDSLSYARAKGGLRALDTAYVTGGGSGSHVLPLLESLVTVPITLWNPLKQVVQSPENPPLEESAGPLLTVAIGLALRQPS